MDQRSLSVSLSCGSGFNADDKKSSQPLIRRQSNKEPIKELTLHGAVKAGNVDAVRKLIIAGAAVNIMNESGKTPLQRAFLKKNLNMFSLLVAAGADTTNLYRHKGEKGCEQFDKVIKANNNLRSAVNVHPSFLDKILCCGEPWNKKEALQKSLNKAINGSGKPHEGDLLKGIMGLFIDSIKNTDASQDMHSSVSDVIARMHPDIRTIMKVAAQKGNYDSRDDSGNRNYANRKLESLLGEAIPKVNSEVRYGPTIPESKESIGKKVGEILKEVERCVDGKPAPESKKHKSRYHVTRIEERSRDGADPIMATSMTI
jgi:hypothetical protein